MVRCSVLEEMKAPDTGSFGMFHVNACGGERTCVQLSPPLLCSGHPGRWWGHGGRLVMSERRGAEPR